MFVVVRIRKGAEIVKDWFGVRCAENLTLADLFEEFRSGSLDHKPPLELNKTALSVSVGQKKTDLLTKLSPDVSLGEALPCLGNFIDFSIIETDNKEDNKSMVYNFISLNNAISWSSQFIFQHWIACQSLLKNKK